MSLITDSSEYSPGMTNDGTYIDQIPSFNNRPEGFRCPCNNRCYSSRPLLVAHVKTATHKKWIDSLNSNRSNYFAELEKERQVVKEQKIIMAQMQREIAKLEHEKRKMMDMIHFLSDITSSRSIPSTSQMDLLDFN